MTTTLQAANDEETFGYTDCESLLPGLPTEWTRWPVGISVGFVLTPVTCVYRKLFEDYTVRSMTEALSKLFAPVNREIFVGYRFCARSVVPAYGWYAEWPLARRGKEEPVDICVGRDLFVRYLSRGVRRRGPMQGAAPWEREADDTLFEIWNEPVNVYGSRAVKMLRVGGPTTAAAIRNWTQTARVIRTFERSLSRSVAADAGSG